MLRLSFLVLVGSAVPLFAQGEAAPLRFTWKSGQTLSYKVVQTTTVEELTLDEKAKQPTPVKTTTTLTSTKRWAVTDVNSAGVATLEMSVTAMKQEVTQTVGDGQPNTRVIDSANPDDAKVMEFLGKPLLTVKLDPQGQLVEAKSDNPAATDRLKAELPFRLVLPDGVPTVGAKWSRAMAVKLPPPLGTGESFDAKQQYTYQGEKDGYAVIGMVTTLKSPPSDPAVMPALIPVLWDGNLFFDAKSGRYHGGKLTAKNEVTDHLGSGTKFRYVSEYTEALEQ